ncbi:nuclear transport factor 2 family protein [Ekhidna sp.]
MIKTSLFLLGMSLYAVAVGQAGSDKDFIKKAIESYASSGDQQNVKNLSDILHDQYRLVWYGGKDDPFVADKSAFISQFEKKEWGGDSRKVTIKSIEVFDDSNAVVKVVLNGNQAQMRSFLSLIKVGSDWKIIGELVTATFK